MNLTQAFRLSQFAIPNPNITISFVGAGGKTTALFQLARELSGNKKKGGGKSDDIKQVIVSATTHLHIDQISLADFHLIVEKREDFTHLNENIRGVVLVTGPLEGDRTKGLNADSINRLHEFCRSNNLPLLIEADGSRQRPLKAPSEQEPVIPAWTEAAVVVTGLTGLGKPLAEKFVHRPEIFAGLSGLKMDETITPEALVRVITHPAGGLKNIPLRSRRLILLNQVDSPELQAQAKRMSEQLLSFFNSVIIASLNSISTITNQQETIHAVCEPVAGIILAGGGSSRFGRPKQLLDWHGKSFVRTVTETALTAGLSPVVVVTGSNAVQVEAAVKDLPVIIVRNQDWQSGQSSSIRTGLTQLSPLHPTSIQPPPPLPSIQDTFLKPIESWKEGEEVGSAVFLLADQPQITPAVIHALTEEHARTLAPIVAPMVGDQRANPVLFDRATFPELLTLKGDVGGRAIFNKVHVNYLNWHDESILSDVDTPEEYGKIVDDR